MRPRVRILRVQSRQLVSDCPLCPARLARLPTCVEVERPLGSLSQMSVNSWFAGGYCRIAISEDGSVAFGRTGALSWPENEVMTAPSIQFAPSMSAENIAANVHAF